MTTRSLLLVSSNVLTAILIALIVNLLVLTIAQGASTSAFSVNVFDARSGNAIVRMTVGGVLENSSETVTQQTDVNGMAHFNLAPGNWRFTACHQSILFGSSDGHTASTWLVACNQLWLPLVTK